MCVSVCTCVRTYVREQPADQKVSCVCASWHGAPAGSAARFSVPVSPIGPPVSPLRLRRRRRRRRGGYPHSGKDKGAERRMDSLSYPQDAVTLDPTRSVGVQESEKKWLDHFNVRDGRDHRPTLSLTLFLIHAALTQPSPGEFTTLFISVLNPQNHFIGSSIILFVFLVKYESVKSHFFFHV